MILIYGKVPGSFEICPGKVGNFLSSCREVKSAHSGNTAHHCAMCHYYHGKPFWMWENQSSAQQWPVAVPKTCVGGQTLGQNWLLSAYRSYHSSNGMILATDLWKICGDAGPVLGRIYFAFGIFFLTGMLGIFKLCSCAIKHDNFNLGMLYSENHSSQNFESWNTFVIRLTYYYSAEFLRKLPNAVSYRIFFRSFGIKRKRLIDFGKSHQL